MKAIVRVGDIGNRVAHSPAPLDLGPSVSALKVIFHGGEVKGPVGAFPGLVGGAGHLVEVLVEGEVVPNRVLPADPSGFVVRVIVLDPVVNLVEGELPDGAILDGLLDELGVGDDRFSIFAHRDLGG